MKTYHDQSDRSAKPNAETISSNSIARAAVPVLQLATWKWVDKRGQPVKGGFKKKTQDPHWELIDGDQDEFGPPDFEGRADGEIYQDEEPADDHQDDPTYRGARTVGNSNTIARLRYGRKRRKDSFSDWKFKKHAHHIVPASLHGPFKALTGVVDTEGNAIMLPAFEPNTERPAHLRLKYRDHPVYTQHVRTLINAVTAGGHVNQQTLRRIMDALRPVNKLVNYRRLDNIPYNEFRTGWNNANPGQQV